MIYDNVRVLIKDIIDGHTGATTQFWDEEPLYGPDYSKGRICRICSERIVNKAKEDLCKACGLPIRTKARFSRNTVERLIEEKRFDAVILWRV